MPNPFNELCAELNTTFTPALVSAGYTAPAVPFNRHEVRYEFKRRSAAGTHTVAVLFRRDRQAEFSVQLYVEPVGGLEALQSRGGQLIVGTLTRRRPIWPFGVQPFGTRRSRVAALMGRTGPTAQQAVGIAIALLPEAEAWWRTQRSGGHIVAGVVRYVGLQS